MDYAPIFISLRTASLSIFVTFFVGLYAARMVLVIKNKIIKMTIDSIFALPLVLPPTVVGFFLLYLLGVKRPIGQLFMEWFHWQVTFSWSATVIAAAVMSFPLMYRSAKAAFEQVNPDLMVAGKTLGMSNSRVFWRIMVPTALPGVASGAILAFARGFGEFGATSMIAGNIAGKTRTLPLAVYSAVSSGDMELAKKYVAIILGISFVIICSMNYLATKEKRAKKVK